MSYPRCALNLTRDEITPDLIRKMIDYDPLTGWLTWRERGKEFFAHETAWKIWHKRYPGTRALATDNGQGYGSGSFLGYRFAAHRVVWAHYYGNWPQYTIDHINGVRDDNRIVNLRDVTSKENSKNQRRNSLNTSGVSGVRKPRGRKTWYAGITKDGERVHLGSFQTKAEAIAVRKAAEAELGFHPNHGRAA